MSSRARAATCRGCAFPATTPSDSLTLNVYVPEQDASFAVDQPLLFSVLAYEPNAIDAEVLAAADPAHLQAMGIGYEQLQLVPTGRAELELTTLNLDLSVDGEGESQSVLAFAQPRHS